MTLNTIAILIICFVCFVIFPFIVLLIKNEKSKKKVIIGAFAIYVVLLIIGVTCKIDINIKYTTISYQSTSAWCSKYIYWDFSRASKWDFLINLFMLIPMGLFISYMALGNKSWWQKLIILFALGAGIGLMIETMQFILPIPRMVQLSDIILNATSTALGGMQYIIYIKIVDKINKK